MPHCPSFVRCLQPPSFGQAGHLELATKQRGGWNGVSSSRGIGGGHGQQLALLRLLRLLAPAQQAKTTAG